MIEWMRVTEVVDLRVYRRMTITAPTLMRKYTDSKLGEAFT